MNIGEDGLSPYSYTLLNSSVIEPSSEQMDRTISIHRYVTEE